MPSINDVDSILSGVATPKTPSLVPGVSQGFSPSISEVDNILKSQPLPSQPTQPQQAVQTRTEPQVQPGSPLTFGQRAAISFGDVEGTKNYLKNIGLDALEDSQGNILIKKGDKVYNLDEAGFSAKDIADMFGKALPFAGSILGAIGGATAAGAPTFGIAAAGGGALGGAAGGAIGETLRQGIGSLLGVNAPGGATPEVAKEAGFGALAGLTGGVGSRIAQTAVRAVPSLGIRTGEQVVPKVATRLGGEAVEAGLQGGVIGSGQQLAETGDVGEAAKGFAAGFGFGAPLGPLGFGAFAGAGRLNRAAIGGLERRAFTDVATAPSASGKISRYLLQNFIYPVRTVFSKISPSASRLGDIKSKQLTFEQELAGQSLSKVSQYSKIAKQASPVEINWSERILANNRDELSRGVGGFTDTDSLLKFYEDSGVVLPQNVKDLIRTRYEATKITSEPLAEVGARFFSRTKEVIDPRTGQPVSTVVSEIPSELETMANQARRAHSKETFVKALSKADKERIVGKPAAKQVAAKPGEIENVINNSGAKFKGFQEFPNKKDKLVLFDDPETGSTLSLGIKEVTPDNVRNKINASRKKFNKPELPEIVTEAKFKSIEDFYDKAIAATPIERGQLQIKSVKTKIAKETSPFSSVTVREEFDPSVIEDRFAKELIDKGDSRIRNLPQDEQYGAALKIAREGISDRQRKRLVSGLAAEVTDINVAPDAFDARFATNANEATGTLVGTVNSNAKKGAIIKAYLEDQGGFDNLPRELKELLIEKGPDAFIDAIDSRYRNLIRTELEASGKQSLSKEFDEWIDAQLDIIDGVQDTNSLVNNLKRLQSLKLSFSFVPNAFQSLNSLLASDFPSLFRGFGVAFTAEGRARGEAAGARAGALFEFETGLRRVRERAAGKTGVLATVEPVLEKFVNTVLSPFRWTEEFLNRTVAANTAFYVMEKALVNNQGQLLRGWVDDAILEKAFQRGKWSEQELLDGMNRFINKTQFGNNPMDLPAVFNTPLGSLFFQFKSFAYKQLLFLGDQTIGELKAGNPGRATRNLLILLTMFPAAGYVVDSFRSILKGEDPDERDLNVIQKYFDSLASIGAFGILGDATRSMENKRFLQFMAGPTFASTAQLAEAFPELAEFFGGDIDVPLEAFGRITAQQAGGLGSAIRNRLIEE